jgi:hypothetical protein
MEILFSITSEEEDRFLTTVNMCSFCEAKIEIPNTARMERFLPNSRSS